MMRFLCLVATSISPAGYAVSSVDSEAISTLSVVDFVSSRFADFVFAYSVTHAKPLEASEPIRVKPVGLDGGENGYYFDFDADLHGYHENQFLAETA